MWCNVSMELIVLLNFGRTCLINSIIRVINLTEQTEGEFTALFSSMRPGGLGQLVNIWKGNIG